MKKVNARLSSVIILTPHAHVFVFFYFCTHTHLCTHTSHSFVCLLLQFLCIELFHKARYMTGGKSWEAAKKKDLAELQVLFFFP